MNLFETRMQAFRDRLGVAGIDVAIIFCIAVAFLFMYRCCHSFF